MTTILTGSTLASTVGAIIVGGVCVLYEARKDRLNTK